MCRVKCCLQQGRGLIICSFNDLSISKPPGDKVSVLNSFWATTVLLNGDVKTLNPHFLNFSFFFNTCGNKDFLTILDAAKWDSCVCCNIQFNSKRKENENIANRDKNARISYKTHFKKTAIYKHPPLQKSNLKFFLWAVFRWNYILNWALSIYLHFSLFLIFFLSHKKIWITLSGHENE